MKHVYTHDNITVLHSVKNVLALHDIESVVKNEHLSAIGVRHGIQNTFHELWILNDGDLEQALSVIHDEVDNPVSAEPWICANCNEENEGVFAVCWKCQSAAEPNKQE